MTLATGVFVISAGVGLATIAWQIRQRILKRNALPDHPILNLMFQWILIAIGFAIAWGSP